MTQPDWDDERLDAAFHDAVRPSGAADLDARRPRPDRRDIACSVPRRSGAAARAGPWRPRRSWRSSSGR